MLLEYGANPNVHGDKPKYYQTPLQQATTQKVVQNLLKYGADPNANMMKSNDKDEHLTCSTIDVFLERHPEAIEDFLNECISTNGQELDSDELQIIFNFELFFNSSISAARWRAAIVGSAKSGEIGRKPGFSSSISAN